MCNSLYLWAQDKNNADLLYKGNMIKICKARLLGFLMEKHTFLESNTLRLFYRVKNWEEWAVEGDVSSD